MNYYVNRIYWDKRKSKDFIKNQGFTKNKFAEFLEVDRATVRDYLDETKNRGCTEFTFWKFLSKFKWEELIPLIEAGMPTAKRIYEENKNEHPEWHDIDFPEEKDIHYISQEKETGQSLKFKDKDYVEEKEEVKKEEGKIKKDISLPTSKNMEDSEIDNLTKNKEFINLITAFITEQHGEYGESLKSAVEQYIYWPALKSKPKFLDLKTGKEVDLINHILLSSRQGGRRYSGSVSEYKIIEACGKIVLESLMRIQIQDVLDLIGYKGDAGKRKKMYLSDLAKSKNEKDKELLQALIGSYINYLTDTKVAKALSERVKKTRGDLEKEVLDYIVRLQNKKQKEK